ncbi:hypothetical protein ABID30_001962 [Enterococcus rotai]|uniref:DUF2798 domain-containing protein n=1 Tax=Enterococcus rotai TaxID=118060 RepID=A0A0U2WNJ6_9ENTE|nr:hypothetical protein ATZ35_06615 [Enterococcus rotai]
MFLIDLKKYNLFFTIFYAGTLTALVSLTLTLINAGIDNFNFVSWLRSWLIAFAIVFACSFFLPSVVRKSLNKIITIKE